MEYLKRMMHKYAEKKEKSYSFFLACDFHSGNVTENLNFRPMMKISSKLLSRKLTARYKGRFFKKLDLFLIELYVLIHFHLRAEISDISLNRE